MDMTLPIPNGDNSYVLDNINEIAQKLSEAYRRTLISNVFISVPDVEQTAIITVGIMAIGVDGYFMFNTDTLYFFWEGFLLQNPPKFTCDREWIAFNEGQHAALNAMPKN